MKVILNTALFLTTAFVLCGCNDAVEKKEGRDLRIKVAQVVAIRPEPEKEFSFIAKPFRTSQLSFRVGGPIDRFEVYAGNYYRRGSIIAEIDPRDFHIRKARAEGIYNQAKAEFERVNVLYEKNNISASSYEKAKADYVSAKAAFETATNDLNDTKLIAPFSGYVGEVFIEKFQDVKATQPVISFVDIDRLKIETYVTQDIAVNIQNLKDVKLRFDAMPDSVYEARIVEISKNTTSNNLSYLLTALLPNENGRLLSGMSGRLILGVADTAKKTEVVIPQISVCHNPQDGDYVWVVDGQTSRVVRRKVVLGNLLPDGTICILSGLREGEVVATSGLRFLSDNMKISLHMGKTTDV